MLAEKADILVILGHGAESEESDGFAIIDSYLGVLPGFLDGIKQDSRNRAGIKPPEAQKHHDIQA